MIDKKNEIKDVINNLFKHFEEQEELKLASEVKISKTELMQRSVNKLKEYNKSRLEVETSNEVKSKFSLFILNNSSVKVRESFINSIQNSTKNNSPEFLDYDEIYLDVILYLINLFQKDEPLYESSDITTTDNIANSVNNVNSVNNKAIAGINEKVNVANIKLRSNVDRFILNAIINEVFEDASVVYDKVNFLFFTVE